MASYLNAVHFTPPPARRRDVPDDFWSRCPVCEEFIFSKKLERNLNICTKCEYHFPISARERVENLLENFVEYEGDFPEEDTVLKTIAPSVAIIDDISTPEPLIAGEAVLSEHQIAIIFVGDNSTGFERVDYARFLHTISSAKNKGLPLITFYDDGTVIDPKSEKLSEPTNTSLLVRSSQFTNYSALQNKTGDRQGEWLSFIQLANIVTSLEELSVENIPHITVLTAPYSSEGFITSLPLGDIVLAEPKPANPEIQGKNNGQKHAIKVQTSQDFAADEATVPLEGNVIDMYVPRKTLKETLDTLLSFFAPL